MKTIRILGLAGVAVALLAVTPLARGQASTFPAAINYQGKLTDDQGDALTNGYYVIEFAIWKDSTLGGAIDLAWDRTFPVHVVEGGLFNVLLTDDGATNSLGGNGSILDAFGGDRYLGLTIRQDPNGTVSPATEIKPRQRLVSAPFAITANGVVDFGISNSSLASGSVTMDKIATNAVGTNQIANGAVTAPKIEDGAVTSAKLKIDGGVWMNDQPLYLRLESQTDTNHALERVASFGTVSGIDGPALYGYGGGVLGTTGGGKKAALSWDNGGLAHLWHAPVNATSWLPVDQNSVHGKGTGSVTLRANVDGLLMYYAYGSRSLIAITNSAGTVFLDGTIEINTGSNFGKLFTLPVSVGDEITIDCITIYYSTQRNQLLIVPFGLDAPTVFSQLLTKIN
jgi:hypothetical protein